jgi:hypothetical protein
MLRLAHGFEQRHAGRIADVVRFGRVAEAARRGEHDRLGTPSAASASVQPGQNSASRCSSEVAARRSSAARSSGAHSSRMPRLVLVPTAGARRSAQPRACAARPRSAGVGERGAQTRGRWSRNSTGRHAMPVGEAMHVAGLQRIDLRVARIEIGAAEGGTGDGFSHS